MLQQPTETLFAADLGKQDVRRLRRPLLSSPASFRYARWHKGFVVLGLMRPQLVVIVDEHGNQVVEMPLPENDKVLEELLPQRLVETLHERDRVGRTIGRLLHPQT